MARGWNYDRKEAVTIMLTVGPQVVSVGTDTLPSPRTCGCECSTIMAVAKGGSAPIENGLQTPKTRLRSPFVGLR